MWHKPCRTFNPWCLCIKTRCLWCDDCPAKLPCNLLWCHHTDRDNLTRLTDMIFRADSRLASSQWERLLLCYNISHWLGTSLDSRFVHSQYNTTIPQWSYHSLTLSHRRHVKKFHHACIWITSGVFTEFMLIFPWKCLGVNAASR